MSREGFPSRIHTAIDTKLTSREENRLEQLDSHTGPRRADEAGTAARAVIVLSQSD